MCKEPQKTSHWCADNACTLREKVTINNKVITQLRPEVD